jgi:hypothetical protein
MVDLPQPPWVVPADEVPASNGAEFAPCRELVTRMEAKMGAKLVRPNYTRSQQWGFVMRATLVLPPAAPDSTGPRLVCWVPPNGEAQFMLDFSHLDGPSSER